MVLVAAALFAPAPAHALDILSAPMGLIYLKIPLDRSTQEQTTLGIRLDRDRSSPDGPIKTLTKERVLMDLQLGGRGIDKWQLGPLRLYER